MRRLIDNGTTSPARPPYIGHYGYLRKAYLEGYRPDLYTALVASEKLYEHCAEIDAAARSLIDLIMPELAKSAGATEELKAAAPVKWVGLMNACKAQAEEIVKYELIHIRTHNTDLKKRLLAYSRRYPTICQQTDADPETGCMEFDIEKGRFSFRLTAPYSEERRRAASEAAKVTASNLKRSVV